MTKREVICSQQLHCLSCPLSVAITGKDCHILTIHEIKRFGGYIVNINGKWLEEAEISALVKDMNEKLAKQDRLLRSIRSYFYSSISWLDLFEEQYLNLYCDIKKPEPPFNTIGEEYVEPDSFNADNGGDYK